MSTVGCPCYVENPILLFRNEKTDLDLASAMSIGSERQGNQTAIVIKNGENRGAGTQETVGNAIRQK